MQLTTRVSKPARAPKYVTAPTLGVVEAQHIWLFETSLQKNIYLIQKLVVKKSLQNANVLKVYVQVTFTF